MSPTNVRFRTIVERRPFGPTIAEPAEALRRSIPEPCHEQPEQPTGAGPSETE